MLHKQSVIFVFSLLGLAWQTPAHASKIQCWTNKEGVRECGSMVPPEYAQKRIEVINDRGQVVKVIPRAQTPEELAAEKLAEQERQKLERLETEKKRQDMILLRTFTTERDIELSRKGKVGAIQGIIDITSNNTRTLEKNLLEMQQKAAAFERGGEQPPPSLLDEMQKLKEQIRDNEDFVAKKQSAIIELEKKYDSDLQRYRELKKVKPR